MIAGLSALFVLLTRMGLLRTLLLFHPQLPPHFIDQFLDAILLPAPHQIAKKAKQVHTPPFRQFLRLLSLSFGSLSLKEICAVRICSAFNTKISANPSSQMDRFVSCSMA